MKGSLRLRLAIGSLLAIGLSLLLVWYVLNQIFSDYLTSATVGELTVLSDTLAANVSVVNGRATLVDIPVDPRLNLPGGGRYWQISEDGQSPLRSRSLWDLEFDPAKMRQFRDQRLLESDGPDGRPVLVLKSNIKLSDDKDQKALVIYTATAREEYERALGNFDMQVQSMLIITAIVLGIAAVFQTLVGLRPLDKLRWSVAKIRSGERFDLGDEGPSEVRPLVREINLLLSERGTAIERARARASDLAHGLKTPLTVLAHLAEGLDPKAREIALQQVDLIRQRSDRQLQAARLGVEQMATTRVADIASKLANVLRPVMEAQGISCNLNVPDDLLVHADPADLAEGLGNILDNAVKWAQSEIAIDGVKKDGFIIITVTDDGPGIDGASPGLVLGRGVYSADSKGGSGLGLAISDDITKAYGGFLNFSPSASGGLAVSLNFPDSDQLVKQKTPF